MSQDSFESSDEVKSGKAVLVRQVYQSPTLQTFGRLSRLTQGSGGTKHDSNFTMTAPQMSDPRVKHNLVRVGSLPMGIGLYLFDYLAEYDKMAGHNRQLGVMADEVEKIMPEAVSFHASGYKMVNYEMLDIQPEDVTFAFIH